MFGRSASIGDVTCCNKVGSTSKDAERPDAVRFHAERGNEDFAVALVACPDDGRRFDKPNGAVYNKKSMGIRN